MEKQKSKQDKNSDALKKALQALKGKYRVTSGAVVAAIMGGLLKLTEITKTFPPPVDMIGNFIIFAAVILIVIDIAKGGLYD